jgi:excisionase family DNA binding protein
MPPKLATIAADCSVLAEQTPIPRGYTPRELARLLRVSPDQIRAWIRSGELGAIDTARVRCGRPQFVVLPEHLAEFTRRRAAAPPRPAPRRRRRTALVDYFPDA